MQKSSLLFLGIFLVSACSQQSSQRIGQAPQFVDTKEVQAVGIAQSKEESDACAAELGEKLVYASDTGLLLISDRNVALTQCRVEFQANNEITVPKGPVMSRAGQTQPDLSTLLRLIPAEEIGARSFVKAHPTFDGRGIRVGILDTGVEVDHVMLTKTSAGEPKVVDFQDMSGEGRVTLLPIADTEGKTYDVTGIAATEVLFGIFKGSTLKYSEDLAAKDNFEDVGVVSYLNAAGKRAGRVDTNGDKSFVDEKELEDFGAVHEFTKLGAKKSLTVTLGIAADGKTVSLCFDDGTHGTHVAGISTGFDPNGLQGVAPGAQVVAVKIGDNRLAGGSTTTASMLLAIDYAVSAKVQVINLSYGIRSGGNLGKSAIDQYVDKIAREKGILFSISAGNEGPGLLTTGTPAGANLAITNGAYVSKETAKENYGYAAVEDNNTWYFSSVGPRLDGGLKPTLLAPGSALSSIPPWAGGVANYRGTSMASPQVTGGLALLLSAAAQSQLPTDRASITQAVYRSAKKQPNLTLIEQGHGLMSIPAALDSLSANKNSLPIEFTVAVGKGSGIYIRSRQLASTLFNISVTPVFPMGTAQSAQDAVKTFRLEPSANWIQTPPTLWMTSAARVFQASLDPAILSQPGLHSEKIVARDEATGEVAFVIPVTVVSPSLLDDSHQHVMQADTPIRVGQTLRYFVDVPAGTTSIVTSLESDGPFLWAQVLDAEGRKVAELRDTEASVPLPVLRAQANISKTGVYEIDIVAPASIGRHARAKLRVTALSLAASSPLAKPGKGLEVEVQNNFEAVKVLPEIVLVSQRFRSTQTLKGDGVSLPVVLSEEDLKTYSALKFNVKTSKEYYDLMTDYPFRLFSEEGEMLLNGGLELDSDIDLDLAEKKAGKLGLEITGAFTKEAPAEWGFELTEIRKLAQEKSLFSGPRTLLETGVSTSLLITHAFGSQAGREDCVEIRLKGVNGELLQTVPVCR